MKNKNTQFVLWFAGCEPCEEKMTEEQARKEAQAIAKEAQKRCKAKYGQARLRSLSNGYSVTFGCNLFTSVSFIPA